MQDYLNLGQNYIPPVAPEKPKKPVSVYIFGTLLALSLIQMSRDIMSWIFGIARDYSQFYVSYQSATSDEQKELLKQWITFSENNFYLMNMLNLVFLIAILVSLILLIVHNKAFKWIFLISAFVEIFCWFFVFRIYEYFQVKQFYGESSELTLMDYFTIDSFFSFLDFFTWLILPIAGVIYVFVSPTLKDYLNVPSTPNTPTPVPNNRPLNPQWGQYNNQPVNQPNMGNQSNNRPVNPTPNQNFSQPSYQPSNISVNQPSTPPTFQAPTPTPTQSPTQNSPQTSSFNPFETPKPQSTQEDSSTPSNSTSSNEPPVNPLNPPHNPSDNPFNSNS